MVSILMVTHGEIGEALLCAAKQILHDFPIPVKTQALASGKHQPDIHAKLHQIAKNIDQGDGVLIMTDLYGSTPDNIARNCNACNINTISGLNLPMLLRTLNYAALNKESTLDALTEAAIEGAHKGITTGEEHE